jgi:geranylgeranyl pyrophosphate synthase
MAREASSPDCEDTVQRWRALVNRQLVAVGQGALVDSKSLRDASVYVLEGEGKRLRALLALAVAGDTAGRYDEPPKGLSAALALEILHAASLVHDDLPALDNDDTRRGRPSLHRAFNEATAILTGDALVGRAFSGVTQGDLSPMQRLRALSFLAQAWGDLCEGQQIDIDKPSDRAVVQRLMELKTGALFGASAAIGAIISDLDDAAVERFYSWGQRVGVHFQQLDDEADGDGTAGMFGDLKERGGALLQELSSLYAAELPLTRHVAGLIIR